MIVLPSHLFASSQNHTPSCRGSLSSFHRHKVYFFTFNRLATLAIMISSIVEEMYHLKVPHHLVMCFLVITLMGAAGKGEGRGGEVERVKLNRHHELHIGQEGMDRGWWCLGEPVCWENENPTNYYHLYVMKIYVFLVPTGYWCLKIL